ncbi:MAG: DUF393 domain-containing protein [Candidatus Omnitrophica bacterium]|nr:DUF393 domain-containing protein [Candidatus Omnitrophota bacterium]
MSWVSKIWSRLFLEERSSLSISLFRIACGFTVISHVIPSFILFRENYLGDSFTRYNTSIFPVYFIEWVAAGPDWVAYLFMWLFCIFSFFFLIGFMSQFSAVMTMASCYYFYALNSFHVGTLSWDILLVTMFLMCLVPYHGDFFSVDSLLRVGEGYRRKRPYFLQRLLQVQVGFTFFYTALWKIFPDGNWLNANPIFYLMHKPPAGVTKWFLLRDYLKTQPELCYWLGIAVIVSEFLLMFLLFYRRTRISAIYMGVFFHVVLILTLDVPATFFFLFPAQLCLFVNPDRIVDAIEERRRINQTAQRPCIIFDGHCGFCRCAVRRLQMLDIFAQYQYVDFRQEPDLRLRHPQLTVDQCERELILVDGLGRIYGGFFAFRKMSLSMPLMFPWIAVYYFPGMSQIGPAVYRMIARNRRILPAFFSRC